MNTFFPTTGTDTDWNAAYYRLEDYFRSLRVVNKVHQSQIVLRILERAAAKHALDETQNPTELAMEEARAEMAQWFETILGNRERLHVTGLLSMLATDAPARWPAAFLAEEFPAELLQEMKESDIHAGPDLQVSSMVPRPIDAGPLLDSFNFSDALEKIKWGPAVMAVVLLAALSVSLFLIIQ